MSFFFTKQENQDTLQYDDTAFLHFLVAISSVTVAIFLCLLRRDISNYQRKGINELKQLNIYKEKIKNYNKSKQKHFLSCSFLSKVIIILLSILTIFVCLNNMTESNQMIGFDPYEILGVQFQAPLINIKKAYRKLALEYHPDRNLHNPENAAKFIQISKAYECLTDPEAKEKCEKYGNPDGEGAFKVGIGLPKIIINNENQYFVLPVVFLILLVVVPKVFLAWNSRLEMKDQRGMEVKNYSSIFKCITPKMNTISCSWSMGCMQELQTLYPVHKISENEGKGIKNFLLQTGSVSEEQIEKIQPQVLFRTMSFYKYLANQSHDPIIAEIFPDLAIKLTYFSSYFGKYSLAGKPLHQNPEWIVKWCGLLPFRCMVDYTKQLFNQNLRIGDVCSIQFLDLTPEDYQVARKIPIPNLQSDLLHSKQAIESFLQKFPSTNREYLRKQIQCLPALSMSVKCLIGEEDISEFTVDDFPTFEIKVKKHNKTYGYVTTNNHPFLHNEHFYILFTLESTIIQLDSFSFPQGSQEHTFKFPFRSPQARQLVFQIRLISYCYLSNMDLGMEHTVNVIPNANQNEKVMFHKDDLYLQRMPKGFWESLTGMEMENDSDKELSDDGDDNDEKRWEEEEEETKPRWEEEEKPQMDGSERKWEEREKDI